MKVPERLARAGNIDESIMKVLSNEWQLTALIACQIIIPPDAVGRLMEQRKHHKGSRSTSCHGAKGWFTSRALLILASKGKIEKRKIGKKCEYRLAQLKELSP